MAPRTATMRTPSSLAGCAAALLALISHLGVEVHAVPDAHYEFNVTREWTNPDGYWRQALMVNGELTGPTVRVQNHGRVVVTVNNLSPDPLSVHWHGVDQFDGGQWYDGVSEGTQCPLYSGETMVYNFSVSQEPGTMMYHGHCYANEADGLAGVFIIDPSEDPEEQDETDLVALSQMTDWDEEIIVNLHDWYHPKGEDLAQAAAPIPGEEYQSSNTGVPFKWPGEPDAILINGKADYDCSGTILETSPCWPVKEYVGPEEDAMVSGGQTFFNFTAGKRYLMRFLNTGVIYWLDVHIDDHEFIIINVDGIPVEPFVLSKVDINVGERYDAIVVAKGEPGATYNMYVQNQLPLPVTQMAYVSYTDEPTVETPEWEYEPMLSMVNYSGIDPFDPRWVHALEGLPADMKALEPDETIYIENYQLYDQQGLLTWPLNRNEFKHDPTGLPLLPLAKYGLMTGGTNQPDQNKFLLKKGDVVDLVLVGHGETWYSELGAIDEHPWHLHGMKFWILGYGPGRFNRTDPAHQALLNLENPAKRDMAGLYPFGTYFYGTPPKTYPKIVGGPHETAHCYISDPREGCKYQNTPLGWTVLRIKAEHPGVWDFHCHLLWHYLMNMKAFIIIAPEEVPDMPEGLPLTCGSQDLWDVVRGMAGLDANNTRLEGQEKTLS